MPAGAADPPVEQALRAVERFAREPVEFDRTRHGFATLVVPDDLAGDEPKQVILSADGSDALDRLRGLLLDDLRFEYMDQSTIRDATSRFACEAALDEAHSHFEGFVTRHAQTPERVECFFPLLQLTVPQEIELHGVRLIPAADAKPPGLLFAPDPRPETASVVAVPCEGTDRGKMSERAAEVARHALRLLRAGLREEHFLANEQLRFRLGWWFWFADGRSGFKTPPEEGWDYAPPTDTIKRAISVPLAGLPPRATNDMERCASRALRWFEKAQLEVDPMMAILLLSFAVESMLGRKSGKLKARELALRRAVLAHTVKGSFAHPARLYVVYDEVRSVAVHGDEPPEVDPKLVDEVAWDVRAAINEFVQFAQTHGFTRRSRVLNALDEDPDAVAIAERFLAGAK